MYFSTGIKSMKKLVRNTVSSIFLLILELKYYFIFTYEVAITGGKNKL